MKKPRLFLLTLLLIMLLVTAGCTAKDEPATPDSPATETPATAEGGELMVLINTDFSTFDPHFCTDTPTEMLNKNLYNNLVKFNADMEIQPDLAESWSISDDGLAQTFVLRQGVKFHDGSDFTAADVKATFDRVLDEAIGSPKRSVLSAITEVEIVDEYTVTLHTETPMGGLVQKLAHPCAAIISGDAIEQYGADLATHPVGTGPFMLQEFSQGEEVVMSAFADYFEGAPAVSTVRWQIVPEDSTRSLLLESGEADVAYMLPVTEVKRLAEKDNIKSITVTSLATQAIVLNCTQPGLDDVRVRQALNYGLDRNVIVDSILEGQGEVADAPISKMTWGYNSITSYGYDVEKAKALLADAGYADGFEIEVWVSPSRYLMASQIMENIQAQWAQIGVTMTIRQWEHQAFLEELKKGEHQAAYLGWSPSTGDADQGLFNVFHSTQWVPNSNRALYANDQVDALLDAGRIETDPATRLDIYKQAETIIMDECPWVTLYWPHQVVMYSDKVDGLQFLPTEHLILTNATKAE